MAEHTEQTGNEAPRRGVPRPSSLRMLDKSRRQRAKRARGRAEGGRSQRERVVMQHRRTLWIPWTLILLGVWMATAPFTLGHGAQATLPAGGRELWLSLPERVQAMIWSDAISGALLVVLGWRALTPHRLLSRWAACLVGVWLTLAPVLFWSPSAVAYLNDTFVGALVIVLTVIIPGMPGVGRFMKMGGSVPPGWSYNPSSWPQRWILIALAFAGWTVSRHLAAYQLGYLDRVWEPFFGEGSRQVLTSELSHQWPVSDAALGALVYTFEFLIGFMGGPARWRTTPWMVTLFGVLIIPLGLTHIFLVISQPVVVGAWCTLCLLAAAIMLPMIPLEADEVIAMGQHVRGARRRGESMWRTFWQGGSAEAAIEDDRTPPLQRMPEAPSQVLRAAVFGLGVPWTLVVTMAIGVWLLFAPAVFGVAPAPANIDRVMGALVVMVSVLSVGEVLRLVRLLNVPLAIGVAFAPFFVEGRGLLWLAHGIVMGLLVLLLSIPRGPVRESYGRWDRLIW